MNKPAHMPAQLLLLQRTHAVGPRTFGELLDQGARLCYTLEDEVREQAGQPVGRWKVRAATAIPSTSHTGRPYRLTLEHSPRFGPNALTICNVPGFSGVRMHAGNTEADTEGCPLLGLEISDFGIVPGTSRQAVSLVRERVQMKLLRFGELWLEVANITELA